MLSETERILQESICPEIGRGIVLKAWHYPGRLPLSGIVKPMLSKNRSNFLDIASDPGAPPLPVAYGVSCAVPGITCVLLEIPANDADNRSPVFNRSSYISFAAAIKMPRFPFNLRNFSALSYGSAKRANRSNIGPNGGLDNFLLPIFFASVSTPISDICRDGFPGETGLSGLTEEDIAKSPHRPYGLLRSVQIATFYFCKNDSPTEMGILCFFVYNADLFAVLKNIISGPELSRFFSAQPMRGAK
jgi:hypothetical protein